jgi:serine/threonine protein kinase
LTSLLVQLARSQAFVTEWKYFCSSVPIQQLSEITCPRLAGFELYDCKLLTGCFYDEDSVQHVVSIKVVEPGNSAHLRGIEVLNLLRSELTETSKRLVNINLGNTSGTVEYLVFPYMALDWNSFLHSRSEIIVGLAYQAIRALAAVHSANVMHGDIKPHNFCVRVHQHSHFRVVLCNFDYAVHLSEKHRGSNNTTAYYPAESEYLKYEHPWVSPEVYRAKRAAEENGNTVRPAASLAIDVFSLGLIVGVAVDNECCRDRGKRVYERRDMERVLSSQLDLTMQFRAARCRDDPLARRLLVCATNMMCLLDPLQRCRIDDILREIDL